MRALVAAAAILALSACAEQPDLKAELERLTSDLRGRAEPLPGPAPAPERFSYTAFDLADPFHPEARPGRR